MTSSIPSVIFAKYKNFTFNWYYSGTNRYMYYNYISDTSYSIGGNEWVEFRSIYGQRI